MAMSQYTEDLAAIESIVTELVGDQLDPGAVSSLAQTLVDRGATIDRRGLAIRKMNACSDDCWEDLSA